MKIESMWTRSYRSFKVDDADLPAEARERLSAIRRYDELHAAGCAEQAALRVIGVSRRPKSSRPRRVRRRSCQPSDVKAVLDLRRKHPFMGKAPIQRMLERKGLRLSVSTVGRILSRAIATGVVPLASICEGRVKPRRRRRFDGWAHQRVRAAAASAAPRLDALAADEHLGARPVLLGLFHASRAPAPFNSVATTRSPWR